MTVACRMVNCPYNNENICSAHTVLITQDGRCFNLIKGFSEEETSKIRNEFKVDIEDIDIEESTKQAQKPTENPLEDSNEGDESNDNA